MISIYDAIRERENQVGILQAQISAVQAEIDALRVAARILEGGNGAAVEQPRPTPIQSVSSVQPVASVQPVQTAQPVQATQSTGSTLGMEKKRVWP